ncbi:MAG: fibronectin type III domain-containing protein, partial [Methanosarcinales archaeon]
IYNWGVNGTYTVSVNATNKNGTSDTIIWNIYVADITPPPKVKGVLNDTPTTSTVNLTWKKSPASDFTYYAVYQNGILLAKTTNTYYNVTNLLSNTLYYFNVSAYDDNGLESEWSEGVLIKTQEKPLEIRVEVAPKRIKGDGRDSAIVTVQLLQDNIPVSAPTDLPLELSLRDPKVGVLENPSIVISKGEYYTKTRFTGSFEGGKSDIIPKLLLGEEKKKDFTFTPSSIEVEGSKQKYIVAYSTLARIPLLSETSIVVRLEDEENREPIYARQDTPFTLNGKELIIPKGKSSVFTNYTTSLEVGKVNLTPIPTLTPISASLETVGNIYKKEQIYIIPPKIQAGEYKGKNRISKAMLFVRIENENGEPVLAPYNLKFTLKFNDSDLGEALIDLKENTEIEIKKGTSYSFIDLSSKPTINPMYPSNVGTVLIFSNSKNYGASITTTEQNKGKAPYFLVANSSFNKVGLNESFYIAVQLQDANGNPVYAPHDIEVILFPSDSSILPLKTLKIPSGSESGFIQYKAKYKGGEVEITPLAPNYQSKSTSITIISETEEKIFCGITPSKLRADGQEQGIVSVQLQDADGNPVIASSDSRVTLTLSNPLIGSLYSRELIIKEGTSSAETIFRSSYVSGDTSIIALYKDQVCKANLTTINPKPEKVVVYPNPSVLGKKSNSTLLVQLQDANGRPAYSPFNLGVYLLNLNSSIG